MKKYLFSFAVLAMAMSLLTACSKDDDDTPSAQPVNVSNGMFLVGSGNAAFFSFAPLIPKAAQAVGLEPAAMLSSFQLISGCGRSSSPIAGCTIAVSGISGVEPFVLIRRSIPVMIVTGIVIYVRTLTMI